MKEHKFIPDWLRRLLTSPASELTRWERAAKYGIDLSIHCGRELYRDRALEMAASLSYRTIFSMIPILVLSLLFFRAFVGLGEIQNQAQTWALDFMGLAAMPYDQYVDPSGAADGETAAPDEGDAAPPDGHETASSAEDPEPAPVEEKEGAPPVSSSDKKVRATVADRIAELTKNVASLNFKSIGAIGLALLIYAALALVMSMEDSFNQIYGAVAGRSYSKQLVLYWTVLTLGPVLLLISFYLGGQVVSEVSEIPFIGPLVVFLNRFTAMAASWALLLGLYMMLPNTMVQLRSAAIGSFVAAVLWEFAKWGFGLYVSEAVPYNVLYGSLGLIPLFLWWVYLTWLIVLFGLELSYTLQAMKGRKFKSQEAMKKKEDLIIDPTWMIPLAARIATCFREGDLCNVDTLSQSLNLPQPAVSKLIAALRDFGIIHHVESDHHQGYSLTRPADEIRVHQLLDATWSLLPKQQDVSRIDPAWRLVRKMHQRERELADDQSLADLVRSLSQEEAQARDDAAHQPHEVRRSRSR